MTAFDLAVFAAKLVLGTLAFLLIGYFGSSDDKRVAGVMLAFPVLNGIGPLTSPDKDPVALTQSMMPMIALNAVLFFCFITAFQWATRIASSGRALSYGIGVAGALIWLAVAALIMPALDPLVPSPGWFVVLYLIATIAVTLLLWPPRTSGIAAAPAARQEFPAFWWQRRWRLAFFVVSMIVLLAASKISGADWVGRLSALPLVPLCVLAGLAIDDTDGLPAMRDSILLGPALATVFAWPFTLVLVPLQQAGATIYWTLGIAALVAGWAAYFLLVRHGVPLLSVILDRKHVGAP
jgi:hypothetical protein